MTPEEKDALNRRVAKALGWRWWRSVSPGGWVISSFSNVSPYQSLKPVAVDSEPDDADEGCAVTIPDFCTDPAAADSLLGKMLENGWGVREEYEPQDTPLRGGSIARTSIYMSKSTTPEIVRAFPLSDAPRYTARCYAFLAAHDAQEEQK